MFLGENLWLDLHAPPIGIFHRSGNVVILRSVRKPNRRHRKVRGVGALVVKDRHFLPEGECIGLGCRTCDECSQETNGGWKRRFRPSSARAPTAPRAFGTLGTTAALGALGAGTGLLSPVLLLFFLFLLFAAGLSAAPSGRSRGLAFVNCCICRA